MKSSRHSSFRFVGCGAIASVLTWAALSAGARYAERPPERRVIKTAMNTDPLGAGGQVSWDTIEVAQFRNYARKRGWDDTDLVVRRFVGDDTQKYVASQIAGESPDIVIASDAQITFFDDHGLIEPLDKYLEQWSDYREGKLNEEILDVCRGRDGEVLGLPVYQNAPAVFAIRRDWLEKLGLDAPSTFEEARQVWQAFTHRDPDGNGQDDTYGYELTMQTRGGRHLHSLAPFMLAARVPWYKLDENRRYVPTFNTPEAASILDFIKGCHKEWLFGKDVMYRTDNAPATYLFFTQGRAGMSGPYFIDWFRQLADQNGMGDKVRIIPILWRDEEARLRDRYGTHNYVTRLRCMMKASRNKEVAWRYLEYFFSQEWIAKYISRRGLPFIRGRYLGQFGIFANETPWRMVRNDVKPGTPIDEDLVALVRPVEKYLIRTPLMSAWPEASVAICEVFVDYYNDRYPTAQAALDEAERRFRGVVESRERQRRIGERRRREAGR